MSAINVQVNTNPNGSINVYPDPFPVTTYVYNNTTVVSGGSIIQVTGSSFLTGSNFLGISGTSVTISGNNILIAGAGIVNTGLYVTTGQTGSFASQNFVITQIDTSIGTVESQIGSIMGVTGTFVNTGQTGIFATITNLGTTGSYLLTLINASSAGVSSLNSASGILTLAGGGNVTITTIGQTVTVSGNTGILTGFFYPLNNNPLNYITSSQTGNFVNNTQTGFLTGQFAQLNNNNTFTASNTFTNGLTVEGTLNPNSLYVNNTSNFDNGKISTDGNGNLTINGILNTSGAIKISGNNVVTGGPYYLNSNPSGYITGFNSGLYTLNSNTGIFVTISSTGNFVTVNQTGLLSNTFYPLTTNPSNYITSNQTGIFVTTGQTGSFGSNNNTGQLTGIFYPLNQNPNGYITGINTGSFVTTNQTGNFITNGQTGVFVTTGNTGIFVTIYQTGGFGGSTPTGQLTGQFYPLNSNPSGYITSQSTGSYVTNAQSGLLTGVFYPLNGNPSNYLTSGYTSTGSYIFNTQINSGVTQQFIVFPNSLGNNPYVMCSLSNTGTGNNSNENIIVWPSGIVSTGYWLQLGWATDGNNYLLTTLASVTSGLALTTIVYNVSGGPFYPLNSNPSNYINSSQTGNFTTNSQTGIFITNYQTGIFVTIYQTGGFGGSGGGNGGTGTNVQITGSSNLTTANFTGVSGINVILSSSNLVTILGTSLQNQINTIVNSGANLILTSQTGVFATTGNLNATGSYLYNLIQTSNAGVSSINLQSGSLTLTGAGNITVSNSSQIFTISGNTGILTGSFYPLNGNPSGFITTGQTGNFGGGGGNFNTGTLIGTFALITGNNTFVGTNNFSGAVNITGLLTTNNNINVGVNQEGSINCQTLNGGGAGLTLQTTSYNTSLNYSATNLTSTINPKTAHVFSATFDNSSANYTGLSLIVNNILSSGNSAVLVVGTTGNNNMLVVNVNGNVGINNVNPQYSLDISGSGNFYSGLNVGGYAVVTVNQTGGFGGGSSGGTGTNVQVTGSTNLITANFTGISGISTILSGNNIVAICGTLLQNQINTIVSSGVNLVLNSQTGNFVSNGMTGNLINNGQTGIFVTTGNTGIFVTIYQTGNFVSNGMTGVLINQFVSQNQTGNFFINSGNNFFSYGFGQNIKTVTGNYTLIYNDFSVLFSGNNLTGTLPSAITNSGMIYDIKDIYDPNSNLILSGAQNIDGSNTFSAFTNNKGIQVQSDGKQWWVINHSPTGILTGAFDSYGTAALTGSTLQLEINNINSISGIWALISGGNTFSGLQQILVGGLNNLPLSGNTTSGVGLLIGNPTLATTGISIQCPPMLYFSGNGWGGSSTPMVWRIYSTGVSGNMQAGGTSQNLFNIDYSTGNGVFTNYFQLTNTYAGYHGNPAIICNTLFASSQIGTNTLAVTSTSAVTNISNIVPFGTYTLNLNQLNNTTTSPSILFTPQIINPVITNTGLAVANYFSGIYTSTTGNGIYANVLIAPTYSFTGPQSGVCYDARINSTSPNLSGIKHYLLDISNSGISLLCVTSTGNTGNYTGYVGINNVNPKYPLDVSGNINTNSNLTVSGSGNFLSGLSVNNNPVITLPQYRANTVNIASNSTSQLVNFSSNFPSTGYSVSLTPDSTMATANSISVTSKTVSGFTITTTLGVVGGFNIDYIAWLYN